MYIVSVAMVRTDCIFRHGHHKYNRIIGHDSSEKVPARHGKVNVVEYDQVPLPHKDVGPGSRNVVLNSGSGMRPEAVWCACVRVCVCVCVCNPRGTHTERDD